MGAISAAPAELSQRERACNVLIRLFAPPPISLMVLILLPLKLRNPFVVHGVESVEEGDGLEPPEIVLVSNEVREEVLLQSLGKDEVNCSYDLGRLR
jgi:hypothetical protein